jgi:outer membrane lipopolysaccharide assembly protein LptE/RlpB
VSDVREYQVILVVANTLQDGDTELLKTGKVSLNATYRYV